MPDEKPRVFPTYVSGKQVTLAYLIFAALAAKLKVLFATGLENGRG